MARKKSKSLANKLNFLLLADYAFLSARNKLGIVGIFEKFNVLKLPVKLSRFFVVSNLDLAPGKHKVEVEILDPSGKEIVPSGEKGVEIEGGKNVNTITDVNFLTVKKRGRFMVHLLVDGKKIGKKSFDVELIN